LLGNQVDVVFDALMTTYPYVQSGKLKAIGLTTVARSPVAPEIPTIAEQGNPALAKFNETLWNALVAPKGTDPKIILAINNAVRAALQSPQVKERMREMSNQPHWTSTEDARKFIASDVAQWKLRAKDMKLSIN
jgi:tripartite-type tricarboxylate transporter receptor subunit TctC